MLSIQVIGERIVFFFFEFIVGGSRVVNRIIRYILSAMEDKCCIPNLD